MTEHALLEPWPDPLGAPPFDRFCVEDVLPSLDTAIAEHRAEIAAIVKDERPASFGTVILPLERGGAALGRVQRLFSTVAGAQSTPAIRSIEPKVSALLSAHATEIAHDPRLFARVEAVWQTHQTAGLSEEQFRLLRASYRGFLAGGAGLGGNAKARFAEIDARLADLSVRFGQNVLAAAAGWERIVAEEDLDGLPEDVRSIARTRASARGETGALFTLDRGEVEIVLTFAERRDLRERIWRAFTARGDGGVHDNTGILAEIVALRQERARLLGYPSYAAFKLEDEMAGSPDAAAGLMERVWVPAREQGAREAATLQARLELDSPGEMLKPWDWRFYAEQERRESYGVDAAAVAKHLILDRVRATAFDTAHRLFGLRFEERAVLSGWHPSVTAWAVHEHTGGQVGLLYLDLIARPEKHGGAWMGTLRPQERLDDSITPVVTICCNFAAVADGGETHLSIDEARTLFHEFGHALHGLLSDVTYPSLSGTSVPRDFVEFPSKLMENWIVAPEVLSGLGMPDDLIAAIGRAEGFGQGFATVEFLLSGLVDMALHASPDEAPDPAAIEAATLARLDPPPGAAMRHRLPHFTHLFDGGYAAAYYSYLWSEVLDADAWQAFIGGGDIFSPALGERYRTEVLARGDSRDPMASYRAFLGHDPDEHALMRARGFDSRSSQADLAAAG